MPNGDSAAAAARPNGDPNWREREARRLETGEYKPVPWADRLTPIPDHFVHIARRDPSLVAFTESPQKGELDRQTAIKPGRYLARFYPHLSPNEVKALQGEVDAQTVKFARTADEIVNVYTRGPASCMSHSTSEFRRGHPVQVYGDSDLAVAYIENEDGYPTARTLVWPERKLYLSCKRYGDADRLFPALERLGYTPARNLAGARIRRISAGRRNEVLMPYLDGIDGFDLLKEGDGHSQEWLVVGGPFAYGTSGWAIVDEPIPCSCCGERTASTTEVIGRGEYCPNCRRTRTFTSHHSGRVCDLEDRARVYAYSFGQLQIVDWSISERDGHAFFCSGSQMWWSRRHFQPVTMADGAVWSCHHFNRHGVTVNGLNYARGTEPGTQIAFDLGLPPTSTRRRATAAERKARQARLYNEMMAEQLAQVAAGLS